MMRRNSGRFGIRFLARASALAGTVLAVSVCGTQDKFGSTTGPNADTTPPVVQINLPGAVADTLVEATDSLQITLVSADNVRLKTVHLSVTGVSPLVLSVVFDTSFAVSATAVTTFTQPFVVTLPATAAGQRMVISATATDASANATTVTDTVRVNDTQPPVTTLLTPAASVLVGSGDTIHVLARATDPSGIRYLGARLFYRDTVLGNVVTLAADSLIYLGRVTVRLDSFRIVVPAALKPGGYLLQAFAADSSPNFNKGVSTPDLTVATRDIRPPTGTFSNPPLDSQVVAGDTLTLRFHASDNVGVVSVAFRGYAQRGNPALGTDSTVLRFQAKTVTLPLQPADTTPVIRQLLPVLTDSTVEAVYLEARITDVGGNVTVVTRRIQVVGGSIVRALAPVAGGRLPVGLPLTVIDSSYIPYGIDSVGFISTGAVPGTVVAPKVGAPVRSIDTLSLAIPATSPLAADTVVPFAVYHRGGISYRVLGRPLAFAFVDVVAPTSSILSPAMVDTAVSAGDSVLLIFRLRDNRGVVIDSLDGFALRGDSALGTAVEVPRFTMKSDLLASPTDTTLRRYLQPVAGNLTPEAVFLRAVAHDAAGNRALALHRIQVITGASVRLLAPLAGLVSPVGNPLAITLSGFAPDSVKVLGYASTGAIAARDSSVLASPLGTGRSAALSLPVPAATPLSTDTITPFVISSLGRRTLGTPVVLAFADSARPQVSFVSPAPDTGIVAGSNVAVTVRVRDNRVGTSVSLLGRTLRSVGGQATTVSRFAPVSIAALNSVDTTVVRTLSFVGDSTAELAYIVALVTDGAGLQFSDSVRVQITSGPYVRIADPPAGTQIKLGQTGASILPVVAAFRPDTIAYLGVRVTGRVTTADSVPSPRPMTTTTLTQQIAVNIPANTPLGTITLTPFARTKVGALWNGPAVSYELIDGSLPVVSILAPTHAGTFQVPAGDSLFVRVAASDDRALGSVTLAGFARRPDVSPDSLAQVQIVPRFVAKTIDLTGTVHDTVVRYLNPILTDSTAENVYVVATALDAAGNASVDTVKVIVKPGASVAITNLANGLRLPVGIARAVTVHGFSPDSLVKVGFTGSGAIVTGDSLTFAADTGRVAGLTFTTTATTPLGAETLVPFAVDKHGNRFLGGSVSLSLADTVVPTVSVDTPAVANLPVNLGDSVFVAAHVRDNRGVTQVLLTGTAERGSRSLGTDTTVARFFPRTVLIPPTRDTVITRYLRAVVPLDSTSEVVNIGAVATDSSGNSASASATIRIVSGPLVTVVRPLAGTLTSPGKKLVVEVHAHDVNGVRLVGWHTTGVVSPLADSIFLAPAAGKLAQDVSMIDTLRIPAATPLGTFTVLPFGVDSLGDPSGITPGVTVTVQSAAADTTAPAVSFSVLRRVEVDDSIAVSATDASGVGRISWKATKLGDTLAVYGSGTTGALPGTASDVRATFPMNLVGITKYPSQVYVWASATDSSGARTGIAVAETLTVVAGKTYTLPAGSQISDAIFNKNRNELYLSNTALSRLEVFDLATASFVASIPVGSRPVGLAMWPKDTLGNYADTVIVANSGGTNLSLVDVTPNRREYKRYRLPNYVIQKVKSQLDPATSLLRLTITEYDYADRPQYVAAVCRAAGSPSGCGDVIAVYSTTPTPGQTGYPNRGYLAWENLTRTTVDSVKGHFFWEPGTAALTLTTDTLQVIEVRDSVPGVAVRQTLLGAGVGITADFDRLEFQDSTFVRSAGNYLRALVGEGGTNTSLARVLAFDPSAGTAVIKGNPLDSICIKGLLDCTGVTDRGISDAVFVRDFIANRASAVSSIAINENGLTMAVRADSVYVFDRTLRQTGIIGAGSGATGMDFHPSNTFDAGTRGAGGAGYQNSRLLFAARPDSSIDVFDSYFYGEVTDTTALGATVPVPIRNALVGPVRVATYAGNTVLFGLTSFGLVSVQLPNITNSLFPVAPQRPVIPSTPRVEVRARKGTSPPRE